MAGGVIKNGGIVMRELKAPELKHVYGAGGRGCSDGGKEKGRSKSKSHSFKSKSKTHSKHKSHSKHKCD